MDSSHQQYVVVLGMTGVGKSSFIKPLDSFLSGVRETMTWPGCNTAPQSPRIRPRVQKVIEKSDLSFREESQARAKWGYDVEPDRSLTWMKLPLPPTMSHSHHLPNKPNSEQFARTFLQAVYDSTCDSDVFKETNKIENKIYIFKDLGQFWPKHYRKAEPYSQILPAMLDSCLQKWAQQPPDEKNDGFVDQSTQNHRNPLHFCSALGFEGLGEVYLQMGADPNVLAYPDGQSAIHLAAAGGHTGMIELLFDRDADIEKRTLLTGRTALQLAAFRGHVEAVKLLLGEGADVYVKDKSGNTALALAITNRHKRVANLLSAFDGREMTFPGGWEKEGAPVDGGDNFHNTQPNQQDSLEVHISGLPFPQKECTSWTLPVSRHEDYQRHIHEKHPTPKTISNNCGEQQRSFWSCYRCVDGLKSCLCDDQTRCLHCGGPARSSEVDEGWIAVDYQKCPHTRSPNFHKNHAV